ncbi:MAG: hypothetical protein K6B74_13145 [Ruminococcus sp.]|nr:hypothetical protein [Ruminococcus sp.]
MGAVIGALAGVFAVLLFRFTQRKKNSGEKRSAENEKKQPVKIEYRK